MAARRASSIVEIVHSRPHTPASLFCGRMPVQFLTLYEGGGCFCLLLQFCNLYEVVSGM
jgi:hypothetical protein